MQIDIEGLREDLKQECYGAFFSGGFGVALMGSFDVEHLSEKIYEAMVRCESQCRNLFSP